MNFFQIKGKFIGVLGTLSLCAFAATTYAVSHSLKTDSYMVTAADDEGNEILSVDLSSQDVFNSCVVVNNTPGKWTFYKYGPYTRHAIYAFDGVASDDYLIVPGVELQAGKEYSMTASACKEESSDFTASMGFCYGTDAATLSEVSSVEIITTGFGSYKSDRFSVPVSGTYCIALHANSPKLSASAGYLELHVNKLVLTEYEGGGVVTPPVAEKEDIFTLALATENEFNSCTVIDNNADNSTWRFYKYGPYVRYSAWLDAHTDADDYLVLPAMQLETGREYEISADVQRGDDRWRETIGFYYGKSADAASLTEVSSENVVATSFSTLSSARFKVKASGTYYVALKVASPAEDSEIGQHELCVKNVVVTAYAAESGGDDPSVVKTVPFTIVPTLEETEQLVIIDNNGDEFDRGTFQTGVWNYDSDKEALVYFYSSYHLDADDYVILPLIEFNDTEHAYNVSVDAMVGSSRDTESFEVYISKTTDPSEMTLLYESGSLVNDSEWITHNIPVGIKEAGNYYIAVKATSEKDHYKLMIKNISVTLTENSINIPSKLLDVTVTPADKGALSANVSFKIPDTNIAGTELTGDVCVKVISSVDEKSVYGQPGEVKEVAVNTVQGYNIISVVPSNANGTGTGISKSVYTGVDKPRIPVAKATVSDDNLSLHIEWTADETGVNGGYVDPSSVIYNISRYDSDDKTYDDGIDLTGTFSYDYTLPAGTSMREERFMITARNLAGRDEGYAGVKGIIGTPHRLPLDETLAGGRLAYQPLSIDSSEDGYLYAADFRLYDLGAIFETADPNYPDITVDHAKAIWAFIRYGEPGMGRFIFPKFSTEGISEVKFKINTFINAIYPATDVYATAYGVEPVKIGSINGDCGEGWTDITFVLPAEFGNRKWVSVYFDTKFTDIDTQNIFISRYTFSELLYNDVAVISLDGPADGVQVGDCAEFTATIQNVGKESVATPEVIFEVTDADNNLIESKTLRPDVADSLAPEELATVTFTIEATADILGEYTVKAFVDVADENPVNDFAETDLAIIKGLKPIVDDLTAVADAKGGAVNLSWSKPDIKLTGLDDFEDYAPFHYGKYIGQFKNVDGDGKVTYSYDQCVFDGATKPKAFMVTNPDYLSNKLVQENYTPHSGNQYLVAFCPNDGSKADDWLISPEVKPGTVISFYVSVVGYAQFAERYEVCYSTTTNEPSAFKVLETGTATEMKWQGKAYVLPDDARYFAIHYVSADVFGIMLDDIDYTPVINEKSTFSYNVYADGEKVADNLAETSFTHDGLDLRDYTYNVTTVVDGTEYSFSNTAVATVMGGVDTVDAAAKTVRAVGHAIVVEGYAGEHVAVYTVDGRCVFVAPACPSATTVPVNAGIYLVKAGTDSVKVIVK